MPKIGSVKREGERGREGRRKGRGEERRGGEGRGGKGREGEGKENERTKLCLYFSMITEKLEVHSMTTYPENSGCLLLKVLQPILVGFLLPVPFPVGLKLHSLRLVCTEIFHPLPEGSSHQSPPPVGLQLHNQWFVGFHECPAVIVSCHLGYHSLEGRGREEEGRRKGEGRERRKREEEDIRRGGERRKGGERRRREGRDGERRREEEIRYKLLV